MNKKILFSLFILLLLFLSACSSETFYEKYQKQQLKAKEICEKRLGEVVHFGIIVNPITQKLTYESVCYKEDERHFYYDLIGKVSD